MKFYDVFKLKLAIADAYHEGYEAADEQKGAVKQAYDMERERAVQTFGEDVVAALDNDPVGTLAGMNEVDRVEAMDYVNARVRYEGMIDRISDDIDERTKASDKEIESHANKADGMIHPAMMRGVNGGAPRKVYIVSGNVATFEDGTIDKAKSSDFILVRDAETGEVKAASVDEFDTIDEVIDTATEKKSVAEQIANEYAGQQAAIIEAESGEVEGENGKLTYNSNDGVHTVEILGENGDVFTILDNGVERIATREWVDELKAQNGVVSPVEENAPVVEQAQPVAQTALERVPKAENGEPVYEQADAETAWDAIMEQTNDEELATQVVEGMIADKEAALKKLENSKVREGVTVAEKIAAAQQRKAAIEQAKADLAKWQEIAGVKAKRETAAVESAPVAEETQPTAGVAAEAQPAEVVAEQPIEQVAEVAPVQETQNTEAVAENVETEPINEAENVNAHNVIKSEDEKKALRDRIKKWAKKLGVKVHVLESYDEVTDEQAKVVILEQRTPGWFAGGEVYIYMPHVKNGVDLDKTVVHEVVAHKGIKQMLGEEFGKFLDNVWNAMSVPARAKFLSYVGAGKNATQADRRAAADEYVAALAEKVYKKQGMTAEEKTIWQKIADWFRQAFNVDEAKAEVLSKETLTDEDIAMMIRASYETLQSNKVDNEVASVDGGWAMFRLASSNTSAIKYDKMNGTNVKEFFDFLRGGMVFEKGKPNVFHIANAGSLLERYGIKGKFMVGQFTFSRTHTQDDDHNLGVKEWVDVINNLNNPLAITSYKGLPNEYRIYTYAMVNGKNICVGVNVSLKDGEIELSRIISAYGRDINNLLGKEGINLLYPDMNELKRRILQGSTAPNSLLNATSTASADKDNTDSAKKQGNGTKFRKVTPEMDAEYMAAVENGDMETAERLVKEAAKLAMPDTKVVDEDGYPMVVYHGSANEFTVFGKDISKKRAHTRDNSYFFSEDKAVSEDYGDVLYGAYLNLRNPLVVDFEGRSWRNTREVMSVYYARNNEVLKSGFATEEEAAEWRDQFLKDANAYSKDADYVKVGPTIEQVGPSTDEYVAKAQAEGYDGVIIENVVDAAGGGWVLDENNRYTIRKTAGAEIATTDYVAFSPNQIKSADAVTYDDNGNVIPLNERFDEEKEDIRFRKVFHGSGAKFDKFDHSHMGEGEGMKGFYDRMLPSFVQKYTKRWGAKVGEVTMPNLSENNTMHSVDVTPEMKESVMEGQTMFRKMNEHAEEFNKTHKGGVPVVEIDPNNMEADFAEDGFATEEIEELKERMKKGVAAVYNTDKKIIYLLVPSQEKESVYSTCWHEDTHAAIDFFGLTPEMMDEFYSFARGKKKEDFEALLDKIGYEIEEYPEESLAYGVQAMHILDNWGAETLSKLFGSTAEGAQRQMEIIQPLIDYINNGRQGTQSSVGETVRDRGMYNNTANQKKTAEAEGTGASETATGGLTEDQIDALQTITGLSRKEIVERYGKKQPKPTGGLTEDQIGALMATTGLSRDEVVERYGKKETTRFRKAQPGVPGSAQAEYNHKVRRPNKSGSVKVTENVAGRLVEAYQDSMRALKVLQDAVARETGNEVKDNENAYIAENRMSSSNKAMVEIYERDFFMPLMDEINVLIKEGVEYDDIIRYIHAKHGFERNEYMRRKQAEEAARRDLGEEPAMPNEGDADYEAKVNAKAAWRANLAELTESYVKKFAKRDYSGLTALTESANAKDAEAAAQQMVDEFENDHDTTPLWEAVNKATKETLRREFVSGLIDRATYDTVSTMFDFYIPLRGWDENVAANEYEYFTNNNTPVFTPAIKTMHGRKSLSDDPIATIGYMAGSAIARANRNLMKQKFLNFVMNNPTSLATVSEQWYVLNNATNEWEPYTPTIPEEATPEQVVQIVEQFEADMLAKEREGVATRKRAGLKIGLHATKAEGQEHVVRVKRNGKEYCIYINGNPRAAQAVNGLTNPDVSENKAREIAQTVKNFMARAFTSMNPAFIITNLSRDVIWAGTAVAAKEDAAYVKQYTKNITGALFKLKLPRLLRKFQKGTLDMNNEVERYFNEFMLNGGETGFTQVNTVEDYKKNIKRFVDEVQNGTRITKKAWRGLWNGIEFLNRSAEDVTRFNVYMTSRQMGRSIAKSVWDAKEITVNFNKKGSGELGAGYMNFAYIFFNATIQSIANFGKIAYNNPGKTGAALAAFSTMGFLMPLINAALMALGDDDDEEMYWNMPDWVRRNNIVLFVPWTEEGFITIPLPHELRPFYGMGEAAYSALAGRQEVGDAIKSSARGFTELLPLDFTGNGGDAVINFTPTIAQPIVQIARNTDYFGKPIYRDNPFNKRAPEWTKAYKGTNSTLVAATKWLNELGGGDDVKSGGALDWNPAWIEHAIESYLGGVGKTMNKAYKTVSMIWDEEMREAKNIPVVSSFYQSTDEKTEDRSLNERYFNLVDGLEDFEYLLNGYRKKAMMGEAEYEDKFEEMVNSGEFDMYQIVKEYSGIINELNSTIKNYPLNDTEKKDIETTIRKLKQEMLTKVDKLQK